MGISVTELGYIGLGVSDIAEWKNFTSEIVGLEIVPGNSDKEFTARADYWFQRIFVNENGTDDLDFVGWRVADENAFLALCDRLTEAEIPYEIAPQELIAKRQVLNLITLIDPAGTPTEIFYGPRIEAAMPFHPSRPMHGKFKTGDGGVGHFAINTPNVQECHDFYSKILGMKSSIEFERQLPPHAGGMKFTLRFVSCNTREHSLAFGDLGGEKRLDHFMMEVTRMEDVGLTRDIVKQRKIPIFLDLGQHHNDHVLSFYYQTPSGWNWECGWGGSEPSGQAEWGQFPIWGHEHKPPMS